MNLNKVGSKGFKVNFLADYLLLELGKDSQTRIEIIDCINFVVIKGKTNSEQILDFSKSITKMKETFPKYFQQKDFTHTIDLMQYESKLEESKKLEITLFNTNNCVFNNKQIELFNKVPSSLNSNLYPFEISEDNFSYKSEFPFGYSLNQGRLMYYFLKSLFYSIPTNYLMNTITFKLDMSEKNENIIEVFDNYNDEKDNVLKSLILDHVDFNLEIIKKEMINIDWENELINPTEDFQILKENKFGMIIV